MLKPGTILQDRYVIVDMLAEGGMGEVYRAEYTNLRGRYVAVKASKIDAGNETLRRQFEKEAVLLFDLKHGALPKVFDLFSDERGQFLVMEFIDGRDLARVLEDRGNAVDFPTAMRWADQLLDALEYLHERQPPVIHRDIKPQNIKLTTDGRVVLLDFGLAKSTGSLHTMTTKSIYGHTPEYAPIEQIHGEGTDERSDIYSLSATIYTLLAYRPPARATVRASAALEGRPDPLEPLPQINGSVPFAVWEVLQWGMSLMREKRPNSARAMRKALHDSLRGTVMVGGGGATSGIQAETHVESTADLWAGRTNPQAGAGAADGARGYARPTVGGGEGQTSHSAPETTLPPEAFARTLLDDGARPAGFGPVPGETALSTESLGSQTVVDRPAERRAATVPPPDEFVTQVSPRDALTGVGFAKDAPTIPIKDVVNRASETISADVYDPLRTNATPVIPDSPTVPTDRALSAPPVAVSSAPAIAATPDAERARKKGILFPILALVIFVAAAGGSVLLWQRYRTSPGELAKPGGEAVATPPTVAPPVGEPAAPAAPVDVLTFSIETMTGTPFPVAAGSFPKDADFHIRYSTNRDGRFYVIVVNPDRSETVFLSDQPAAQAKVATNEVRAGTEYVFPGPGVPMWFQTGTEKLILVFAPTGAEVPKALTGPALATLPPETAAAIDGLASSAGSTMEWGRRGDSFTVRTIEGPPDGGLVVLDANIILKSPAVFPDVEPKPQKR